MPPRPHRSPGPPGTPRPQAPWESLSERFRKKSKNSNFCRVGGRRIIDFFDFFAIKIDFFAIKIDFSGPFRPENGLSPRPPTRQKIDFFDFFELTFWTPGSPWESLVEAKFSLREALGDPGGGEI